MTFIKNLINKLTMRNYRFQAVIKEIVPVFSDRFNTTNKERILLREDDDRVGLVSLETQNGIPVLFHKDFEYGIASRSIYKHKGNLDFEVNGISAGVIYKLENTGYLENSDSFYKVILVSDDYVYSRLLGSGGVILHSHDEIERFKEFGALSFKKD